MKSMKRIKISGTGKVGSTHVIDAETGNEIPFVQRLEMVSPSLAKVTIYCVVDADGKPVVPAGTVLEAPPPRPVECDEPFDPEAIGAEWKARQNQ